MTSNIVTINSSIIEVLFRIAAVDSFGAVYSIRGGKVLCASDALPTIPRFPAPSASDRTDLQRVYFSIVMGDKEHALDDTFIPNGLSARFGNILQHRNFLVFLSSETGWPALLPRLGVIKRELTQNQEDR